MHAIELEDMLGRDPKFNNRLEKKLVHSNLMIERNARETKRSESVFEIGTKLLNPYQNF